MRASLDSFGFGAGALVFLLGPFGRRLQDSGQGGGNREGYVYIYIYVYIWVQG